MDGTVQRSAECDGGMWNKMRPTRFLKLAMTLLTLGLCGTAAFACDFPPKGLTAGKPWTLSGTYDNEQYRYTVTIPPSLMGYDNSAGPHHGIGIILGER